MSNKGESLTNERIADYYTSLLHLSGNTEPGLQSNSPYKIYDGSGNVTGFSLSGMNDRVIINNYIEPIGYADEQYEILDAFYPIGSILLTVDNNNPSGRIKGTKWIRVGDGRFLPGVGDDTITNELGRVKSHNFTPGIDGELLEQTSDDIGSGNIAGEYGTALEVKHLPIHNHNTNTQTSNILATRNETAGVNSNFIFYFGPSVNPEGLNNPSTYYFLEQDRITAFQNNSNYEGVADYRTQEIKDRHEAGFRYTNEDFNPTLGTYSLDGWDSVTSSGPGWAGINENGEYITNSPRPVNVEWPDGKRITRANYDTRDTDRVHPGLFRDSQLLQARNLIINVLGAEEAKIALAGVNRLKELDETVESIVDEGVESPFTTSLVELAGDTIVQTSNTGLGDKHNNIPPSYGLYMWVRVPLDYIEYTPSDQQEVGVWRGTITRDKISSGSGDHDVETNSGQFNLGEWARNQGINPWNGRDRVEITIAGSDASQEVDAAGNKRPVYIYSDDPADVKAPAMVIGNFPNGLKLINNGFILGRGGNGGHNYYGFRAGEKCRDYAGAAGKGQDGGDAIKLTGSDGPITIDNTSGGIAGGGGGGAAAYSGNGSGGGGGAGGGWGGTSDTFKTISNLPNDGNTFQGSTGSRVVLMTNGGGEGGLPGEPGKTGRYYMRYIQASYLNNQTSQGNIITDLYGKGFSGSRFEAQYVFLPGIGGEAGGSGAGGRSQSGTDNNGTGGGGGRILSPTALGGGVGAQPGTYFSSLDSSGAIRTDGPELVSVTTTSTRGRRREVTTLGTSYDPLQPTLGWVSTDRPERGRWGTQGSRFRANGINSQPGIPFTSSIANSNSLIYLSPTGWTGPSINLHMAAYNRGGSGDEPGTNNLSNKKQWAAGGGGWGAKGGDTRTSCGFVGGKGGFAVRNVEGIDYEIIGGLVYGEQEG